MIHDIIFFKVGEEVKKKESASLVLQKCKSLNYDNVHPFLVPLYLVVDLADVFRHGIDDEMTVLDYFFLDLNYSRHDEISMSELLGLVSNLNELEKDYLLEHLPHFYFPIPRYVASFLKNHEGTTELPDNTPETINLFAWFQIVLKELYEESPMENTSYIQECLQEDNVHMFKAYVDNGDIPLTMSTYNQESLLHEAVKFEATEIIKFLISVGMDVNSVDYFGSTPIYIASAKGYKEGFQILKDNHAHMMIVNKENVKPLEVALYSGKPEFIDYLIHEEFYPVKWLLNEFTLSVAIHEGITDAIEYLLDTGELTLDTLINPHDSLFDLAIYERRADIALKWAHRPDFVLSSVSQGTPLTERVMMADLVELIPWLEENHFNLYQNGVHGHSPLELATIFHANRFFDYFLEHDCHIEGTEMNLLKVASINTNQYVLEYLKNMKVNFNVLLDERVTPFIYLGQRYDHQVYLKFIDEIDITFHNQNQVPLLIDPTFHNDTFVVSKLLEMGANPDIPILYPRRNRYYPILNAIFHHNLEMIELLVKYHANINIKTDKNITPLFYAFQRKRHGGNEVYQYLRKLKAKPGPLPFLIILSLIAVLSIWIMVFIENI